MEWIEHIYLHTYIVSAIIPVGAFFLRRLSFIARLVLLLIMINVGMDVYATYIDKALKLHTHFAYNVYLVFEFPFIVFIYSLVVNNLKSKNLLRYASLIVFALLFMVLFYDKNPNNFNYVNYTIGGLLISSISYLILRKKIVDYELEAADISLWFLVANFILYLITIPALSLVPLHEKLPSALLKNILTIKNSAYILWAILLGFGFICQKTKTT